MGTNATWTLSNPVSFLNFAYKPFQKIKKFISKMLSVVVKVASLALVVATRARFLGCYASLLFAATRNRHWILGESNESAARNSVNLAPLVAGDGKS